MDMPKSLAFGLPVLFLMVLIHMVYYAMTDSTLMTGIMGALGSAVFLAVLAIFTTVAYTLATKAKEGLMTGYIYVLTVLIIANLLRDVYMQFVAPALGL